MKKVSIKEAYKRWSNNYDTDLPYLFEAEMNRVFPLLGEIRGKNILDLGCGTGRYSILLAKKGANVTAVDFSREMLNIAKNKAKNQRLKINFKQVDLKNNFPFKKEEFDIILVMLLLGHFKHPGYLLKKISKSLRLGGICIISTFHPKKSGGKLALVPSLGLDATKYKQSIGEYKHAIKKSNFLLKKILNIKFPKKIIIKAKKDGINLNPFRSKPFLIIFKTRKIR